MKLPRLVVAGVLLLICSWTHSFAEEAKGSSTDKSMAKAGKGAEIGAALEAHERAIWETFKNKDSAKFLTLVDKEAWGADAMGFSPASTVPDMMKDLELQSYTLEDFKTTMVSKEVYLLTYTAHQTGSFKGQPMPAVPSYASTLFVKRGNKWLALYHQESMGMAASN